MQCAVGFCRKLLFRQPEIGFGLRVWLAVFCSATDSATLEWQQRPNPKEIK
uniref:Uncharacterized protein n=1 Tax=Arundo donax TaxID=35708 RepID=A0A0A9HAU5_ARUDO